MMIITSIMIRHTQVGQVPTPSECYAYGFGLCFVSDARLDGALDPAIREVQSLCVSEEQVD